MSDVRPMGGPPPTMGGQPPAGGDIKSKMSVFNPTDLAAKKTMGDIRPGMTVGEFLERNFGVRPEDPIEKFIEAAKGNMQNRTMAGKMGVQPQGPGQGPPAPPPAGMPPGGPPPGAGMPPARPKPPIQGMDEFVNRLR